MKLGKLFTAFVILTFLGAFIETTEAEAGRRVCGGGGCRTVRKCGGGGCRVRRCGARGCRVRRGCGSGGCRVRNSCGSGGCGVRRSSCGSGGCGVQRSNGGNSLQRALAFGVTNGGGSVARQGRNARIAAAIAQLELHIQGRVGYLNPDGSEEGVVQFEKTFTAQGSSGGGNGGHAGQPTVAGGRSAGGRPQALARGVTGAQPILASQRRETDAFPAGSSGNWHTQLIREEVAKLGFPAASLREDPRLCERALSHSQYMAKNGVGPNHQGFQGFVGTLGRAAEEVTAIVGRGNIGSARKVAQTCAASWYGSGDHAAILKLHDQPSAYRYSCFAMVVNEAGDFAGCTGVVSQ